MVDRRRQAAIALPHHAVPRPPRKGPADPYAGSRALRDEGPNAREWYARLGPLGPFHPEHAAARSEKHRQHHVGHCPICRDKRQPRGRRMSLAAVAVDPTPIAPPSSRHDAFVELENVTHTYGRGERMVHALTETSLRIERGDFVALVGPSGCGKSTILKLVTGLINASTGYVYVAGRQVGAEPVRVGMAFQNPTMLPWLTLLDNVMLPLKIVPPYRQDYRAKRKGEFRDKIEALLAQVGLAGFSNKFPWQLSGGMMQRASLCRALIHEPQLLMLDEPFGALDQFTREELWGVIQDLWMTR